MDKPKFRLINKPPRRKWYSVFAQFEYEKNIERAKFIHPGDAYTYAVHLLDDYKSYAVPLIEVMVEC